MSAEKIVSLKKVLLFADLSDELLGHLAERIETRSLQKGSFLFREGEVGEALFIIGTGELEVFKGESTDPQRQVLAKLTGGEYLGEMALLENKPRSASAWALSDCQLFSLKRQDFNALLEQNPQLAIKLTATISSRLRTVMDSNTTPVKVGKKATDLGKTRVFISYSRRDKEFVKSLHEAISNEGINTWVDWENIPLTADWWDEIERGIRNSDAFAYVISPDSLSPTSVCLRELTVATDNNKRLVPVLYREAPKSLEIPRVLADSNWVWMRNEAEMHTNLNAMLTVINTDLDWVREHTRLLARALDWDAAGRNNNLLLRGPDLTSAQAWLTKASVVTEPKPLPVHGDYIQASQKDAAFRQGVTRGIGVAFIALMLVATIVSGIGFNRATRNQYAAQTAQVLANSNLVRANLANTAAAENLVVAQNANTQVAESLEVARSEANKALARNLASQALLKNNVDHSLALLLGAEAFIKDPSSQARSALFDVLQFTPYKPLFGHPGPVTSVAYRNGLIASASCGEISASQCVKGEIILWDANTNSPLQILTGDFGQINSLAFNADGSILAAGGCVAYNEADRRGGCLDQKGQITLWDINAKQATLRSIIAGGHTGPVTSVAFSPNGDYFASGSFDKSVILWWAKGPQFGQQFGAPLGGPDGHTSFVNSIAFSPDSQTLASGGDDRRIILWDVKTQKVLHKLLSVHKGAVTSIAFSPDGKMLASGSYDKSIILWSSDAKQKNYEVNGAPLLGHTGYVTSIVFNTDGTKLASASFDKSVIVWDIASHQPDGLPLTRHTKPVNSVAFNIDTGDVISASDDKTIILWELKARPSQSLSQPIITGLSTSITILDAASANGNILLAQGADQTLYAWDLSTRQRQLNPTANLTNAAQSKLSLKGSSGLEADVNTNNSIALSTLSTKASLKGHTGAVNSISLSPDGKILASASVDQTIILWGVDNASSTFGQTIQTLTGHTGSVLDAVFTPDGKTLISVGDDQLIILWNLDTNNWLQLACAAAGRALSLEEWQQYLGNAKYEPFCK